MKKSNFAVAAFTLLSIFSLGALAHADNKSPADNTIEYRKGNFHMIKMHFGPMAGMVKGEVDYDKDSFLANAEAVKALSMLVKYGFTDGSAEGDFEETKAKPEIWENRADFDKKLETFQIEAAKLAEVAASGDMAAIKPQFGKTGESCKACHKEYRNK